MKKKWYNNAAAFHAPVHLLDSEKQTFGCRHANPEFCAKHSLPKLCALVRADKICCAPPQNWPKQFKKLQVEDPAVKKTGLGSQL